MSIKEEVIKLIQGLPEETTLDDIIYRLYAKAKIESGLNELNEGKGISHEEALERIARWLN